MRLPTLWNRDRNDPFAALHHEVEKVFDDFTRGFLSFSGLPSSLGTEPSMDVRETDAGLKVTAELPGVDEKDVEVTLANGVLTIRGEKKTEHEERAEGRFMSERSYGSFQRSVGLPFEVDDGKVEASFGKGVLKILLPRSPEIENSRKRIEITPAN